MTTMNNNKAFTLMELMITITILGILAGIAYPFYLDQMYKSRRSDGQTALLNLAAYVESFYTENNTYVGVTLSGLGLTNSSQEGYYQLSISNITPTTYTLTAAPTAGGPQVGDTCGSLTLDQTNTKGPSLPCWGQN